MGVALSFQGRQDDPARRAEAILFARKFAAEMDWSCEDVALTFPRATLGKHVLECPKLSGLAVLPHFACEPVPLVFIEEPGALIDLYMKDEGDRQVNFTNLPMVKTHFGGPEVHAEICEFLSQIKKNFVPSLEVDDETGFFDHGDRVRLEASFDASWIAITGLAAEARDNGQDEFEIGGLVLRPKEEAADDEFGPLDPDQRELLLSAEQWLSTTHGDTGYHFDRSRESILDLDLLMSDADEGQWIQTLEDAERDQFIQSAGVAFGRTLIALLGGSWALDDDQGLILRGVGHIGLRFNPFQIAANRFAHGPPYSFTHHLGLFTTLSERLR